MLIPKVPEEDVTFLKPLEKTRPEKNTGDAIKSSRGKGSLRLEIGR